MPTLNHTDTTPATLKINHFPSKAAFDAAVNANQIGSNDISFVEGDADSLPTYSASDSGKALMVNSNGQLYWGTVASGGLVAQ